MSELETGPPQKKLRTFTYNFKDGWEEEFFFTIFNGQCVLNLFWACKCGEEMEHGTAF